MTRRAVVDRSELFEAANKMTADGKEVTALALLNALGGGSLTTIYKYLTEWAAEHPKPAPTAGANEIPGVVQNAFASTWRVATMEAAKETAAIRERSAQEVKVALKQFEGALEAIIRLEAEAEKGAVETESLRAIVTDLESKLSEALHANASLNATVVQMREQLKSHQVDCDRLRKELAAERQQKDKAVTEAAEVRGRLEALTTQNKELLALIGQSKGKK